MLSSLPDADAEHEVTFGDVNALLNVQTISQMLNPSLTITDGIIQAVFPGANELYPGDDEVLRTARPCSRSGYFQHAFDVRDYMIFLYCTSSRCRVISY